ncbi:hypothetical protein BN873_150247 [Candidatus Competibacter denitrificans Run_A_D11]|uniref:Uncharacterized protein n=1 Tax=Candidatus Competibacter denitrificans Run_A_D11 TaxID=1400863 RepID=W6M4D9_9GAMM|nr:hypothetical protein BN873_150247 [Candidatus Competibacter denitrificans Run_A_D11]
MSLSHTTQQQLVAIRERAPVKAWIDFYAVTAFRGI